MSLQFFANAVLGLLYIPALFDLGNIHFVAASENATVENIDAEFCLPNNSTIEEIREWKKSKPLEPCKYHFLIWMAVYTFGSIPNVGIIFCRFIYTRYAHGLIHDMGDLLHKIVIVLTSGLSTGSGFSKNRLAPRPWPQNPRKVGALCISTERI